MAFAPNEQMVQQTGGPVSYYTEYETTSAYVEKPFGANINTITVTNDHASDPVQLSFNGATLAGDIKAGESMTLITHSRTSIYVKSTAGDATVRIWGW